MGTEKVVPYLSMRQIAGGCAPWSPIPGMHNQDPVQRRLDTWKLKACDSEDLLDQLNMTVYCQQQFDSLLQQLALLRQRFPDATGPQPGRNARDELPLLSCRFLRQSRYLGLLCGKL